MNACEVSCLPSASSNNVNLQTDRGFLAKTVGKIAPTQAKCGGSSSVEATSGETPTTLVSVLNVGEMASSHAGSLLEAVRRKVAQKVGGDYLLAYPDTAGSVLYGAPNKAAAE